MAVAALIKFVQGALVGTAGVALVGNLGAEVTASNANNTNIQRWRWTIVDAPAGSAITPGVISDGATSTLDFTPDVRGGYHVDLKVWEFSDATGDSETHRLVFLVEELSGRKNPPFDAEAPALNFASTPRGWAEIMDAWFRYIDGNAALTNASNGLIAAAPTKDANGESVGAIRFVGTLPELGGLADGYEGQRLILHPSGDPLIVRDEDGGSTAGNRITTGIGEDVTVAENSVAIVYYGNGRWRLIAGRGPTVPVVEPGGDEDDAQFHGTGGVFAGSDKLTFDQSTKRPKFRGRVEYPAQNAAGASDAQAFDFAIDSGDGTSTLVTATLSSSDHKGVLEVSAKAAAATGAITGLRKVIIPYTTSSGAVTLGTAVDITPFELVHASLTLSFTTGTNQINIRGSEVGDTNWVGQYVVTMALTP